VKRKVRFGVVRGGGGAIERPVCREVNGFEQIVESGLGVFSGRQRENMVREHS
jgi:hypothetical protein